MGSMKPIFFLKKSADHEVLAFHGETMNKMSLGRFWDLGRMGGGVVEFKL